MDWPEAWVTRRRPRRLLFGVAYLGLVAAAAGAAAVWLGRDGDLFGVVLFGGGALLAGHVAAIGLHAYRGARRRDDGGGVSRTAAGLIFRYDGTATYLLTATLVLTDAALVYLSVDAAGRGSYLPAAVWGVLAVPLVVLLLVVLRLMPGELVVGPDGVHHRGLTFTTRIPWIALTGATAGWDKGPVIRIGFIGSPDIRTRRVLGSFMSAPETVSGRWLAADPALALLALTHYIRHPEDRWELTTEASLRRLTAPREASGGGA
ncbi:hypothetical protein KOI35_10870 [Actinoplanes bogorensis]|uniref:PH domain-containing protein n=1 Tax=Paractinoplanes bogorensis TaxID=1610840 RepID=A0ABS5YKY5_9ACTN|nr:hypothetical protein [Actinoplanes bogorensis]MBU2663991.1 hypothetical protein [Actinoplanes bogorensis]